MGNEKIKWIAKFLISVAVLQCLTLVGSLIRVDSVYAAADVLYKRLAGQDRYGTSQEISKNGWQSKSDYAIIATGNNYPDALSAASLAKKYNAPILITESNKLTDIAHDELVRLNVKQVFIVGGTGVVSNQVETAIKNMKIATTRLAGQDRYETSVKIAERLDTNNGVVVVSGEDYPGALFMATIACKRGMPIILVPKDRSASSTLGYIRGKNIPKSYIIGGEDLISINVSSEFPHSERIYGRDKYERNLNALKRFDSDINYNRVYVATGENFPDALSGAALAALTSSPIILANRDISNDAIYFMKGKLPTLKEIYSLGGEAIVSPFTLDGGVTPVNNTTDNFNFDTTGMGNSTSNIINEGFYASQGSSIYYGSENYYGLYKANIDGTNATLLNSDTPRYINVLGPWIYYSNLNDYSKLYKIRTDGTGRTKILDTAVKYLTVINNTIYYSDQFDGGKLYKVNVDGTNKTKLNEDETKYINVVGDWIYYSNQSNAGKIYKIRPDGTQRVKMNEDDSRYVNVWGNYLYYINFYAEGDIYRLSLDGNNKVKLNALSNNENYIYDICVDGGWIYYNVTDLQHRNWIYKIKWDGTSKTLIGTTIHDNINIINGQVK